MDGIGGKNVLLSKKSGGKVIIIRNAKIIIHFIK